MCDPITMGVIAVAGGAMQAKAQKEQGEYEDAVAKNNAIISERAAKDAERRGRNAEDAKRLEVAQLISKQRAQGAANGVDIQGGSMMLMLEDSAMMGELDALTIRSNAANEAYGHRTNAMNQRAQGALSKAAGKNAAMGTILTTAGKTASIWQLGSKPKSNLQWTGNMSAPAW